MSNPYESPMSEGSILSKSIQIRRVGVLSCAKMFGALYAILGLIIGAILSLIALAGASLGPDASAGLAVGVGAVILLPIFYGLVGFIGGALMGFIYNLVAGFAGGIELHVSESA